MYISRPLLLGMLSFMMNIVSEQRRRTQRQSQMSPETTTHHFLPPELIIAYQDLNRYRANPQLKLLIGPVTAPQSDTMPALDTMGQAPIDPNIEQMTHPYLKDNSLELKTVSPIYSMQVHKALNLNVPPTPPSAITITDAVKVTFNLRYLIVRGGATGEIMGYCDDHTTAVNILNRIANIEIKKRDKKGVRVFRRDLKEGNEVQVCTQATGLWNGGVKKEVILDIVPVPVGICV
jgi:hypothetical protein